MWVSVRIAALALALIALPASASAAPPPGPPPSWTPASVESQAPPSTPPASTPPSQQAPTTPTSDTPNLRVSCKRHSNKRYSCVVRTTDSSEVVARCTGRGKVTSSRREACRQKALKSLGFAAKAKAAQSVPATYNPDIMVCPREADANSYGDFQTTGPVIFPRDTTQDGWVGFANQVYWWNGSKWVYWLTTTPLFHFKPSNIFEQAFETRDWYDAKLQPSSGVWNYHGPKNIYYAVVTVLYWAPQPSYPYATTTAVLAHQDPLATNPNGTICLLGVG